MRQREQCIHCLCIAVIVLMQACAPAPVQESAAPPDPNLDMSMEDVILTTADNVTLSASWVSPVRHPETSPKAVRRPVVILLHDHGFNRRDWGIFIPDLVRQGYQVLALDLRGHGQSRKEGNTMLPPPEAMLQSGLLDVQAALGWVQSQKNVDPKRMALIGVGVGADLTYLAAGQFNKILRTAVVISPSYSAITDGQFFGVQARAILFCASSVSQQGLSMQAAQTLSNFALDPKQVKIYNSDAHGFAMFYKHPTIKQDILAWLQQF